MVLLILESLGSTEFLFILVMALVFFGPRKLPQISRSLGKNLADFRRASEDFKTTWHREVNLEEFNILESNDDVPTRRRTHPLPENDSLQKDPQGLEVPSVQAVTPDRVIARRSETADAGGVVTQPDLSSHPDDLTSGTDAADVSRKRDWL